MPHHPRQTSLIETVLMSHLPLILPILSSPKVVEHEPAKQDEDDNTGPKDPLVLPRPPFHHAYRIPRDPKGVGHRIKPFLCVLQCLPLRRQIPQDGLAPSNILVQRRVRAREEVLLPQHVPLSTNLRSSPARGRHAVTAAGTTPPLARSTGDTIPGRRRTRGASVRVLRGAAHKGSAAKQLGAVLGLHGVVTGGLEAVELGAVLLELGAKVAEAVEGLLLLGRVELLFAEGVVLVERAGEGREAGRERAESRGGEARRRGLRGVGPGVGGVRERREVLANGGALLESRVESCVLMAG